MVNRLIPYNSSGILTIAFFLSILLCICLYSLCLKIIILCHFPIKSFILLYYLLYFSPTPCPVIISFYIPGFTFTPGCVLISEYRGPGAPGEKEHIRMLFLSLDDFTQYDLF